MDDASPRFRQDLEASATEAEGVACVDVRDPEKGTNFRFYDFEYQLALQFNGQPLRDIVAWASEAYGVDLTVDGINEFAGRLSELGFLETGGVAAVPQDATPAVGIKVPTDGLDNAEDNAEDEWMSNQGSKTATFVPDPGMLDGPSELTPVAPELPMMDVDDDAPAPAKPADAPTPPPRLFDIPSPAAATAAPPKPASPASEAIGSPAPPAAKPAEPAGAKPAFSWAVDLDDKLQGGGESRPAAASEPAVHASAPAPTNGPASTAARTDDRTPPPVGLPKQPKLPTPLTPGAAPPRAAAAPAPPGLPERRQPPAPDAVQMAPFSPDAAPKPSSHTGRVVAVILLLLVVGAAVAYFAISRENARVPPAAMRVRVLSPTPAAVYRWFSGRGTVTDHEARTLAFDSSGMLAELLPPGTSFAAGDILGRLRGAAPIETLLSRHRARLAFYQQMRESMRAANNRPELRQSEIRLAEKQRLIDETNASLAQAGRARGRAGRGGRDAGQGRHGRSHERRPMVRVKGRMLHGGVRARRRRIAVASKLAFCRVEVSASVRGRRILRARQRRAPPPIRIA